MKKIFNRKEWDKQYKELGGLMDWLLSNERHNDYYIVARCQSSMWMAIPPQKSIWKGTDPFTGKKKKFTEYIYPDSMGPVSISMVKKCEELIAEYKSLALPTNL